LKAARPRIVIHRVRGRRTLGAPRFGLDQLGLKLVRTGRRLACRSARPRDARPSRFDELHVDAHAGAAALHAAFEHVTHVEVAADLLEINRLALIGVLPITKAPEMRERSVVRLSVTPSTK
jgi:hypothetical protein